MSYSQELRSFGDGLRYFFPQDRSEKMFWNTHSCGLQTGLSDFKELAKQVKTNQGKRQYLISHPKIQLKPLLKFACYNYLYEIDGIKIIDSKFIKNANHYFPKITLYYLHHFHLLMLVKV